MRQTTTWRHGPRPSTSANPGTPIAAAADVLDVRQALGVSGSPGQRLRAAVACERAAANASTWRTTSAPSAASETRTERSSLLAVPV